MIFMAGIDKWVRGLLGMAKPGEKKEEKKSETQKSPVVQPEAFPVVFLPRPEPPMPSITVEVPKALSIPRVERAPGEGWPIERYSFFNQKYIPTEVVTGGIPMPTEIEEMSGLPVEITRFTNGMFLRAPGDLKTTLAECQDRASLICDDDGNIKVFALADGVTNVMFGGQTAQLAVDEAIKYLTLSSSKSLEDRLKHAPQYLQDLLYDRYIQQLRPMALKEIHQQSFDTDKRMKYESAVDIEGTGFRHTQIIPGENGTEDLEREYGDGVGATTLISGVIDGNMLRISCAADGGFVVISKEGTLKRSIGARYKAQLDFRSVNDLVSDAQQGKMFEHFNISLEDGDYIFVYSDGLYRNARSGEKGAHFRSKFSQQYLADDLFSGGIRRGSSLETIARFRMYESISIDDTCILAFQHVGVEEKALAVSLSAKKTPSAVKKPSVEKVSAPFVFKDPQERMNGFLSVEEKKKFDEDYGEFIEEVRMLMAMRYTTKSVHFLRLCEAQARMKKKLPPATDAKRQFGSYRRTMVKAILPAKLQVFEGTFPGYAKKIVEGIRAAKTSIEAFDAAHEIQKKFRTFVLPNLQKENQVLCDEFLHELTDYEVWTRGFPENEGGAW